LHRQKGDPESMAELFRPGRRTGPMTAFFIRCFPRNAVAAQEKTISIKLCFASKWKASCLLFGSTE
jgi:hypothetical protein